MQERPPLKLGKGAAKEPLEKELEGESEEANNLKRHEKKEGIEKGKFEAQKVVNK